jgi:YVTN family beta-propeller protein
VAVNSTTNTIYAVNSYASTVAVIDGATNAVTATIAVPSVPLGVAVNPVTNTVYLTNQSANTVTVINGATNAVSATISLGSGTTPQGIAVNPTTNTIYVTNEASSTVSVISGLTNTVTASISTSSEPLGIDVDPITNSVYVGDPFNVVLINGTTNTVFGNVAAVPVPYVTGIAADPGRNIVYATNWSLNSPAPTSLAVLTSPLIQLYWSDVNGDGVVNVNDLVLIGQHWLQTGPPGWISADVDRDGAVNVQDLVTAGQHWQQSTQ